MTENKSKLFLKTNIIIYTLLLTDPLLGKSYSNVANQENSFSMYNFNESKKIKKIRNQLHSDKNIKEIQNSNAHILSSFDVDSDFLRNKTFQKEIQIQKRSKRIIMKGILKGKKKHIVHNISKKLKKDQSIPNYMVYLALNESNFNSLALSRTKARGVWQFMPMTARQYGLQVGKHRDDRINTNKATKAAAPITAENHSKLASKPCGQST